MTLRPRLFLPVLALSLAALMALVAPSIARADTLTWIQTYSSPQHRTVNEADVWIGAAFNAVSFSGSSGWGVGLIKDNVYATGTYNVTDRTLPERGRHVAAGDRGVGR